MSKKQLKSSYCLEQLNEDTVLLMSENDGVMLSNQVANAILREISQKAQSREELLTKFAAKGVSLFEVMQVLFKLEQDGYITENNDFFEPEQAAYWESLGLNASKLAQVLQQKSIGLTFIGKVDRQLFEAACTQAQLRLSENADIQLVLTDDYNAPELHILNQKFEQHKTSWLLAKPTGTQLWLGPTFVPGKTACWECLNHRLELHKPINKLYQATKNTQQNPPQPYINHPLAAQMMANLVVIELIKWLYHGQHELLHGKILTWNTQTLEQQYHIVIKRPQCKACGDPKAKKPTPIALKQAPLVSTLGGYRTVLPEESFEKYKHHISPVAGIVSRLKPYGKVENAPIYNYSSGRNLALQSVSMFWLNHHLRSGNGGKGKSKIQAKMGAIGEAIERYSLMYHGNEYTIQASLNELEDGIHPNHCMNYSDAQLQNREQTNQVSAKFYELTPVPFDPAKKIDWAPVYSMTSQKFKYLPANFCYAQYPAEDEMRLYAYPDSNGCAAGNTLEEAILQGFLELIERDAAAIWWYNCIKRPAVDLNTLQNPYLEKVSTYYQSIGRSLWVLDITSDLGIPVFVAISHSINQDKEKILYAFGAHVDAHLAIERAIIELNQLLPIVQGQEYLTKDQMFKNWLDRQTLAANEYLVPTKTPAKNIATDYSTLCEPTIYASVQHCIKVAQQQGLETLVLDLTQPDIGLPVVKVIVPGLRHFWRRTAPGRLYDVPVKMGWFNNPLTEEELNPISIFI